MKTEADNAATFAEQLHIYMHDFIQDLIIFGRPRARLQIAELVCKSVSVEDENTLHFKQVGCFKSLKINPNEVANYKPARFTVNSTAVSIYRKLISN